MAGPDFLLDAGTNGFIISPFNLMSTELNSLGGNSTVSNTATSTAGGASGVFAQSNFGNAQKVLIWFIAGGAITPVAGGNITGWWLSSNNGGTNFEKTVTSTALPRAPDFIIPLYNSAYASGDMSFASVCRAPWPSCKVFIQNNSGNNMPASGNLIIAGPVAEKY